MTYGLSRGLPSGSGNASRAHAARAMFIAAFLALTLAQVFTVIHDARHDFGEDLHETPCVVCLVKAAIDGAAPGAASFATPLFLAGPAAALGLYLGRDRAPVHTVRSRGPPVRRHA